MLDILGVGSIIALLSVWAGYPLVVSVLAACRRRPVARALSARPTVSFIIATRERDDAIAERVRDCLQTQYESSRLEVVVGIDSQRVAPPAVTPYLSPSVTVVRGDPPGGKAATLNAAVRASRGEILVFTDVYQRFDPAAVGALVEAFWDPQIGAVSGALQVPDAQGSRWVVGRYWRYERWLREQEARLHSAVGVTGSRSHRS
jgi:cellulose synthase/poly-beta-1,6-N-acetylglucosamine synthase-like glycosyltransferase